MRIVVTGAAGFVGARLVDRLARDGHDITAFVHRTTAERRPPSLTRVVVGDVRDGGAVQAAIHGAEVVYHLARAHGHGVLPHEEVNSVNAGGTGTVARACREAGVRVLVHASSAAVYGSRRPGAPLREDAPLRPDSPYARSKVAAEERAVRDAGAGVSVVVARIPAVVGPGARNWIPLVRSVARGRLPVIGAGANWHHLIDVDDLVEGLVRCAGTTVPRGAVNLAGPEPVTLRALLETIADATGAPAPRTIPGPPVDVYLRLSHVLEGSLRIELPRVRGARFLTSDRRLDLVRARDLLGFLPRVGVREAVARLIAWMRGEGWLPPPA